MARTNDTRERVLEAALVSFGGPGYEATSLDDIAADLGVSKQAILYYFPSKSLLMDAVIDQSAVELADVLEGAIASAGPGFDRIESVVRSVFRLALRRPELLGLVREVSRLGPPVSTRLVDALDPLVHRAREFLEAEMAAGHMRQTDSRLLLMSAYSTVIGVATEVEVLRAVGIEPGMKAMVRRRSELIDFLRSALLAPAPEAVATVATER